MHEIAKLLQLRNRYDIPRLNADQRSIVTSVKAGLSK
jgi:hypothetical protein